MSVLSIYEIFLIGIIHFISPGKDIIINIIILSYINSGTKQRKRAAKSCVLEIVWVSTNFAAISVWNNKGATGKVRKVDILRKIRVDDACDLEKRKPKNKKVQQRYKDVWKSLYF